MRIAVAVAAAALLLAAAPPPDAIQVDAAKIVWKEAPPTLPKGTKSAVLEGDPRQPGMFTMRLRVPAGAKIAPHTHPRPERVTVLSGLVKVGFGERWSDDMRSFGAGDFYLNPPGKPHFVAFPRISVVQITGEGPWVLTPVK